jgi:tetratricopeptide (TPR) repeat protein
VRLVGLLAGSLLAGQWSPLSSQDPQSTPNVSGNEIPLQVIVVRTPEEAQQVIEQLKKGADFTQLAKEKSVDPTADAGGYMGKLSPAALRSELRDALKSVGPGEVTPVVHLPSGYTILKVMGPAAKPEVKATDPARNFALESTGTIRYALDVDGLSEAEAAIRGSVRVGNWQEDPIAVCGKRNETMAKAIDHLKTFLAPENASARSSSPQIDIMQAHYSLAQLYAYQGDMEPAIAEAKEAYQIALSGIPSAIPQMEEALGILYLHASEMENDVYRNPGERDLFPMGAGNGYQKTGDSEKAIEHFLKYLDRKPGDLEVEWLLNLAYMTVDKYPAGVPAKYLIPKSAFESKEDVGRFVDVATQAGLKLFSSAGGVAVDDFENNGLLDVVTSGFVSCGPMHYFHNNGDGTFTDRTEQAGLAGQPGALNLIQTDYNNDGCIDILALRGAWEFAQRRSLLRNNCDGTFTDVTVASGLGEPTSSQAAAWADINNDGLLDLFVGNESGPAQLFLNKGDGTFQDIAFTAGVAGTGSAFSKAVAAADYDNDGYVDLYVSNLDGANFLYHNNHDNTFTEVSAKAGVLGTRKGFATWFFDYDNDGLPDLFVTSYYTSVEETIRTYLGIPHNAPTLMLYKNMGNGTFRDVTTEVGLNKVFMPMGANFGDIDNDGYLDIYLGTGNPSYASLLPNVLLRNHDGKYFVDVTTSSGTGELHKGHGVAFADLARNGNEDIIAEIGGATVGDSHVLRLFENPGHGNDWINLKLVGVKTNRVAIGARIKVTVENEGQGTRSIYRTVGSGGSFGASPLEQHIGLGKSANIQSIEVTWPTSKTQQVFHNVQKNQFLEIKEFADNYTVLERKPVHLGGPKNGTTAVAGQGIEAPAKNN